MPEGSLALLGLVRRVLTSGIKLVGASPKLAKRPKIDPRQADSTGKGTVLAWLEQRGAQRQTRNLRSE
ncbi:unannotated protein [freshwater metagenome]|uniref:Unannotated protein n=1 Tax=freshwater metagenome TaxID=449393 RepID=A0A6J7EAL6_9ZZZZ